MTLQDPRWQKIIATIWLAAFGFGLGRLDEKAVYDAHYWLMSAVYLAGIACAGIMLLREDRKSKAVFAILLASSSVSLGSVDARGAWAHYHWLMTAALLVSIAGCAYMLLRSDKPKPI